MQVDRSPILKVAFAALLVLGFWAVLPGVAHAVQPDDVLTADYPDIQFILSTFSFLVWGVLVMWMCAGFTMLESGSVRTKNASMICLKNVGIFSIAGLAYFFVGYNLMYVDVDGIVGTFQFLHGPSEAEITLFDGLTGRVDEVVGRGHSAMSSWFFQMLFVATTASIVSGAILERTKLWAFWAFTLVLTAFIYPIAGAWVWGGGWLDERGFQDFAGSTVVHTTGGCAALAALLVVGPRRGKFRPDGSVKATPPSNVLLVTLGVLILWLGWFGFNGGSQLALATPGDAVVMSSVLANTNLAAASGLIAAVIVARPLFGRLGLASSLNGALAGLVSITAGPDIAEELVGGHHWRRRRPALLGGHQADGAAEARRCGRCHPCASGSRRLGDASGEHRGGSRVRCPAIGRGVGRGVHVHSLPHRLEGHRPHSRHTRVPRRRVCRPRRGRTRHRVTPRVRARARGLRRLPTAA